MTIIQYRRWVSFSLRMARRGFGLRRQSVNKLTTMIRDFFGYLRDYPEQGETFEQYIGRIVDWDNTDDHEVHKSRSIYAPPNYPVGDIMSYAPPNYPVGDIMSLTDEHRNPHYWERADSPSSKYERWDERWGTRVRCCVRAGLDLASAPSAGVVGFEICDLRRMYKGVIPAWIDVLFRRDQKGRFAKSLNTGGCEVGIWL